MRRLDTGGWEHFIDAKRRTVLEITIFLGQEAHAWADLVLHWGKEGCRITP